MRSEIEILEMIGDAEEAYSDYNQYWAEHVSNALQWVLGTSDEKPVDIKEVRG